MGFKSFGLSIVLAASLLLSACGNDKQSAAPETNSATSTNSAALFLEDRSGKPLAVTSQAFQSNVAAHGWTVLGVENVSKVLAERGFTVAPVLVFNACSGKYSSKLLGSDDTRFVASMIPCRVAIYQTSTGEVVISRMNSVVLSAKIGGAAGEVIKQSGQDMEAIIQATLQKLKS